MIVFTQADALINLFEELGLKRRHEKSGIDGRNVTSVVIGFGYVKALAQKLYGIPKVDLIKATGSDMDGRDPEVILRSARDMI